ncbi:MAG TPA: hypothetical protein VGX23_26480 [Actinocrinis sp.]|nr:hypothetical protein [Actinocrinis sp.]
MVLRAMAAFVNDDTRPDEVESITAGRGLDLPPDALAEFGELASAPDADGKTANVLALKELMAGADLFHAAVLAVLCGSLVEGGASPEAAVDAVLELFLRQLDALAQDPDDMAQAAGTLTFMATMTMLSRTAQTRKRWRNRPEVISRLDELEEADLVPFYLREIFTLHDDQDVFVLDPKNRRAFQFRMVGVRDRLYHCYALLQDSLLRHAGPGYLDADPVDPAAVRYARNRDLTQEDLESAQDLHDHQRFNLTVPDGMFMPGSASPSGLPQLDGTPILVVEPKGATFTWNPANMYPRVHAALEASVELVQEFDPEQAAALLARIA